MKFSLRRLTGATIRFSRRYKIALRVKEEFLSRLGSDLREPLKIIMDASNLEIIHSDADKNLSAERKFQDMSLAKVSRHTRIGIITVLIAAMALAFGICVNATMNGGDVKIGTPLARRICHL